jgi:gluconate 2-dehydrogenase gamma chain
MPNSPSVIDRREALRRTALLIGGAISAPTLAALLAGCETPRGDARWTPRALSADQGELVASIAEHIVPETDTAGARAVGVHRFIDTMLAEYYGAAQREYFLGGLRDVDARAERLGASSFLKASNDQQLAVLTALDHDAYAKTLTPAAMPPFFRTMKELTLLGYYTSQEGATKELRYVGVPGRFEGCVPMSRVGRAWAV